jgi:hypothetical protein
MNAPASIITPALREHLRDLVRAMARQAAHEFMEAQASS